MIRFYGINEVETTLLLFSLLVCGVVAIGGSLITFTFYYNKKTIVPRLYKILAIFDILTGLNAIYFVVLGFTYLKDCYTGYYSIIDKYNPARDDLTEEELALYHDNGTGCHRDDSFIIPISFVITAVVTRLPLFVSVVLSVVRTINIAQPFYRVEAWSVLASIVAWLVGWGALATYSTQLQIPFEEGDYFLKDSFYRLLTNNPCIPDPDFGLDLNTWEYLLMTMVGFVFPVVVMLANTLLQVGLLYRNKMQMGRSSQNDATQLQITVTIILITSLAVACGMPSSMYVAASWSKNRYNEYNIDMTQMFVYGFAFPVLNSAPNPLLLIVRSTNLREHLKACGRATGGVSTVASTVRSTTTAAEETDEIKMGDVESTTVAKNKMVG